MSDPLDEAAGRRRGQRKGGALFMDLNGPPTYRRTLTQAMVRDTLRRHFPDREYADRLVALVKPILEDLRWLQDPPRDATTEELLEGVRACASHCRDLGELLHGMPEEVTAAIPEELRFEVTELASIFRHLGRCGEWLHDGLRGLAGWAEEAKDG